MTNQIERTKKMKASMKKRITEQVLDGWEAQVLPGVYLGQASAFESEQRHWADSDGFKHHDFSTAPFWLIQPQSSCALGCDSLEEAFEAIEDLADNMSDAYIRG